MRRLAAAFSPRRDKADNDKHPGHHKLSSPPSLRSRLKIPLTIGFASPSALRTSSSSTPYHGSLSDHAPSSGSSTGSASLSLPTPNDDDSLTPSLARATTRRSWKDWLGGKRSAHPTVPVNIPPEPDRLLPANSGPPPTTQIPRPATRLPGHDKQFTDEDTSESDDEESLVLSEHPPAPATASPARAQQNLDAFVNASLVPPLPSSPFTQPINTHLFPRSCNRPHSLSPPRDVRRFMFNKFMLQRLKVLSIADEQEILPFASKPPPIPTQNTFFPDSSVIQPPTTTRIFSASPGLRRWISRACFEDRFSNFVPSNDDIHQAPIVGGTLAVASLEFSEFLDVMVDPDFNPLPTSELAPAVSLIPLSAQNSPGTLPSPDLVQLQPTHTRQSYVTSPSPLRKEHAPETSSLQQRKTPTSIPTHSQSGSISPNSVKENTQATPVPSIPQTSNTAKRAVRFVEDDNEDAMPLHLLRQKKMREEKAKFLRAQQRQRLVEQEQERRRQEAEIIEKEHRRLAKEKEKMEVYAEKVAAARLRRESQRSGIIPGLKTDTNNLLLPSHSVTSLRDSERNRHRESKRYSLIPHHTGSSTSIPRRELSDSGLPVSSFSPTAYSFEASSRRGSSHGHSPIASNSGHGHPSRPASTYSTSSEDRPASKRMSGISSTSGNHTRPFATYPIWAGSNQSIQNAQFIPPVPPMPESMNDFVLLPPSAPFMMHQYPRQSRHSSPIPSNSSGSLRGNSTNSSTERVNMSRSSSYQPKMTTSAPPSPGTSPNRHSRNSSGDSRRSSMPVPSQTQSQQGSLPRGRSNVPRSQMMQHENNWESPNPWTALPTQRGNVPTSMPVSLYSHSAGLNTMSKGAPFGGTVRGKGR